ncbi:MAG: hypothetical protein WDN46_03175 [Methylocella sp.]
MTSTRTISEGDDVERLAALFAGYSGAHGTHGEPVARDTDGKMEIKGTAKTLKQPVTLELWRQHVNGSRPLGIGPIDKNNECRWGSIDYDKYDDDLIAIIARAIELELPVVPCRSKSGGLHLFVFLSEPVPARDVQIALYAMAAKLGLSGSEIFPKQTQLLIERGDLPSWMIMPYFGSTYNRKLQEQVGLTGQGDALTMEQFIRLAEQARISPDELANYRTERSSMPQGRANGSKQPASSGNFSDGPPCLQNLTANGARVGSGGNNMLTQMAVYYKKVFPNDWKNKLEEANRLFCDPPRSSSEISDMIKQYEKKPYEYKCGTEPMYSHCNSRVCRNRPFGVGDGGGERPTITGLAVLLTEPRIWFAEVNDVRLELSTAQLIKFDLFRLACAEKIHRSFAPMKADSWSKIVDEAMQNAVEIEPQEDARPGAVFFEMLEQFLGPRPIKWLA